MHTITTTQLRTQAPSLLNKLKKGQSVALIHRSQIVAEIHPKRLPIDTPNKTISDSKAFAKRMEALSIGKQTTYNEREKIYRQHLEEKYSKPIFGR